MGLKYTGVPDLARNFFSPFRTAYTIVTTVIELIYEHPVKLGAGELKGQRERGP